jgi:adenylate cyclase
MKGISHEVIPYLFEGLTDETKHLPGIISEHADGMDLFLDLDALDRDAVVRTRRRLQEAIAAIDLKAKANAAPGMKAPVDAP